MLSLRGVSEFGRTRLNFKTSNTPKLQVAKAMAWNYSSVIGKARVRLEEQVFYIDFAAGRFGV